MVTDKTVSQSNITIHIIETLLNDFPNIAVRLWDGQVIGDPEAEATLVLQHPGALRELLIPGTELGMAEAYLYNDVDIEGNIEYIFSMADNLAQKTGLLSKMGIAGELVHLPKGRASDQGVRANARRGPAKLVGKRHSLERDREAVRYHYDVSNDFYSLFLDQHMVYSCAYFNQADNSLDQAQEAKMDIICRKLRLQPGRKLLDLGCGWGGLILHAARHYGVDATGITLSQPQADYANECIRAAGLADRCRAEVRDYREIEDSSPFDAISSVGMFEHVGEKLLPEYFERAYRLVRPGGVFLNHGIAIGANSPTYYDRGIKNPKGILTATPNESFSNTYVFPDGELVPIHSTLKVAERTGFEVRDVESLRDHYLLTLRQWVHRLEQNHENALKYVDEPTYRVWRLYMSGSAYGFRVGNLNVYQSLLLRPNPDGSSGLPLRREDWYQV